jgi:nucleotide-binding universal stress UspA family protein
MLERLTIEQAEVLRGDRSARAAGPAVLERSEASNAAGGHAAPLHPTRLRTILVPLDGSTFAERAIPRAIEIAARADADLRIVHVDTRFGHPYTRDRLVEDKIVCDYCAELERESRGYVERIARQIRSGSPVRVTPVVLKSRDVVAALCGAVSDSVDLVVMAAYGKGILRRWINGSTAHELISKSAAPVLVVGADGSFATPDTGSIKRVLVALDGSRSAEQAIGPALALGDVNAAEYILLRVLPLSAVHGPLSLRYGSAPFNDGFGKIQLVAARHYLKRIASRMKPRSPIVDTRVVLDQRSIARSIAAHAAAYDADLIAIATRKSENKRWQGSIAKRVVQFASTPVLVAAA